VRELKHEREPDGVGEAEQREFTARYRALLAHDGMRASRNHPGVSHQNGDVESAHRQFKRALDQALRLRGHRDFNDRAAYERFLSELVRQRNATRSVRFEHERVVLQPLPAEAPFVTRELSVRVNRFSLIRVLADVYSVPSRLIGAKVKVRVHAEHLEVYHATVHVLTLARLIGPQRSRIDYRHVIWSLVRKPGAFMAYKYREEMFPSLTFRRAFDALERAVPAHAVPQYLRLLHLAASTAESAVAAALQHLLAEGQVPSFDACRCCRRPPRT
jgi:ribosomal protein S21